MTREGAVSLARQFVEMGFHLVATHGTAIVLEQAGLQPERRLQGQGGSSERRRSDQGRPDSADREYSAGQDTFFDEKAIRRAAVMARIPTITTLAAARAAAEGDLCAAGGHVERCCSADTACGTDCG